MPQWPERQQIKQAVGDAVAGTQIVRTFDELVAALNRVNTSADDGKAGANILIAGPITAKSTITLSSRHSGMRISGIGRSSPYYRGDGVGTPAYAFSASSADPPVNVAFENMFFSGDGAGGVWTACFQVGGTTGFRLTDVVWRATTMVLAVAGVAVDDVTIRGAYSVSGGLLFNGEVTDSTIAQCSGGAITLSSASTNVTIIGNKDLSRIDITGTSTRNTVTANVVGAVDSSGSGGFNVISSNVGRGGAISIASAGTDQVGLNT